MIYILYLILFYTLLGSITYLVGQRLHTKNRRILMTYYWIVFIFTPVIDLIIWLDSRKSYSSNITNNVTKSEFDEDEE